MNKYYKRDIEEHPWQNPLVSLETAKLIPNAKQSPWWYECDWFYIDTQHKDGYWMASRNDLDVDYPRPTQALLQRYLRKEHKIEVIVAPRYHNDNSLWYCYEVIQPSKNSIVDLNENLFRGGSFELYSSGEEALDEGLKVGLKLIS